MSIVQALMLCTRGTLCHHRPAGFEGRAHREEYHQYLYNSCIPFSPEQARQRLSAMRRQEIEKLEPEKELDYEAFNQVHVKDVKKI